MALIRWLGGEDMFNQWNRMQREMNRLLGTYEGSGRGSGEVARSGVYPPVNIYDDGEVFLVRAELPGIESKELDISVTGNTLTLRGKRELQQACAEGCYHRREREAGTFRRAVTLPEHVDGTKVTASTNNGILEVILPRSEQAKERKIEVKTS